MEEQAEIGILGAEKVKDAARRLVDIDTSNGSRKDGQNSIQLFQKNKSLLAVSPFVRQKNRFVRPPHDLFVNGIMQIAPGEGFEAAGEPVFYGSHVKLVNVRSGQFLCLRESNVLELVSPVEVRALQSKECSFKINPRYTLRSEGEHVAYEDLIILSHFSGRDLYCASESRVVLSENSAQKTALRLSPFRSYAPHAEDALKAGSIIQFYHKVQNAFMTIDMTSLGADIEKIRPTYEVKAVVRFSTIIDKSCGFWRLETVPTGESGKPYRVDGNIRVGSRIRLRHVLYDKYLLIKEQKTAKTITFHVELDCFDEDREEYENASSSSAVDLHPNRAKKVKQQQKFAKSRVDSMLQAAEFEVLLLDGGDGAGSDAGRTITVGANIRLRHVQTQRYLTVVLDDEENSQVFSSSATDFDKDVYQVMLQKPSW